MPFEDLSFFRLTKEIDIKPFQSKDSDLNDFLFNKAKEYSNALLATTYIIENNERTIAYFSIFNDSLRIEDFKYISKNSIKNWLRRMLPHSKRHLLYFPALKIGRLAVCKDNEGKGLGKKVMQWILSSAIDSNQFSACKFVTVDAYRDSLIYYQKMGFVYFSDKDEDYDTRQMYFDLTPILNAD